MAPRRHQVPPADQRERNALVQGTSARGVLYRQLTEAVVLQDWMQTPRIAFAVDWLLKTVQCRQRSDPPAGIVRFEHFVDHRGVATVEDGDIHQGGAVLRREVVQQTDVEVVLDHCRHYRVGLRALELSRGATCQQRDRPAGRALLHTSQLSSRQLALEEPCDVGPGETALFGADDNRITVHDVRRYVEPGVGSVRHGDVEIARCTLRQQVDQLHGAFRQPVDLVENQQARCRVQLDGAECQSHLFHG